jgi:hypothetical protein
MLVMDGMSESVAGRTIGVSGRACTPSDGSGPGRDGRLAAGREWLVGSGKPQGGASWDHDPRRAWKNDGQAGAGAGILFDLGSHLVDQAVVLFGRPQGVYGDVAVRRPSSGVDDDVFVALHYPGGPRVHL